MITIPPRIRILHYIYHHAPLTAYDLVTQLGVEESYAYKTMNRLESIGVVKSATHKHKRVYVTTARGKKALEVFFKDLKELTK